MIIDQHMQFELDGTGSYYTLTKVNDYTGQALEIPDVYRSLPVREISSGALFGCSDIRTLYIPHSIRKIDA